MPLARFASALSTLFRRKVMPVAVRAASPAPLDSEPAAKRIKLPSELEAAAPMAAVSAAAPAVASPAPTVAPVSAAVARPASPKKKKGKQAAKSGPWSAMPTPEDEAASAAACEAAMAEPFEVEKTYAYELDYRGKLVLAPMVRSGSLPARLLSLYYGAGLVWSPEIVDRAIIGATRTVDPETGVITYSKGQGAIFTTHPIEKPFLIYQIGSSNPELAVEAAKTVEQDVAGIDLNCGCPKPFSTHAGMGAALLSTPDILLNILRALLANIDLPISCKIRLLPGQEDTRHLAARILKTGVRNLTVHCRTRDMRPREPAIWDRLRDVVKLGERRGINVICNGDGDGHTNWDDIRDRTGATTAMLARSAENNASVFSPDGPVDTTTVVIPQLLNISQYTNNSWGNTKFLLMQYKPSPPPISSLSKQERKDVSEMVSRAKSEEELAGKLGVELGKGKAFMDELERRLRSRPEWSLWEQSIKDTTRSAAPSTDETTVPPLPVSASPTHEPTAVAA